MPTAMRRPVSTWGRRARRAARGGRRERRRRGLWPPTPRRKRKSVQMGKRMRTRTRMLPVASGELRARISSSWSSGASGGRDGGRHGDADADGDGTGREDNAGEEKIEGMVVVGQREEEALRKEKERKQRGQCAFEAVPFTSHGAIYLCTTSSSSSRFTWSCVLPRFGDRDLLVAAGGELMLCPM